jgi:amidase
MITFPTAPSCSLLRTSTHEEWNDFRNRAGKLLGLSPLSGMSVKRGFIRNFLGFPEITIPLGSVHGAPFGISLLGPANSDESLIKLTRKILEHVNKA